ncbi:hypothetical protein R84B8_01307 [Treponema sp. R8-4-B8]
MKTKKILFAVFTAALVTALMIGCNVLPDDTSLEVVKVKQPAPDGKVLVRLNPVDENSNARTIRPDLTTGISQVSDFPYFIMTVHDTSAGSGVNMDLDNTPFEGYFEYTAFADDLTLDIDTEYIITVTACSTNNPSTTNYLAWGTGTIDTTSETDVTIVLHQIVGDVLGYEGTGTFSWKVPTAALTTGGYETATLKLDTFANFNKLTEDLLTGNNNNGTNATIPSGYYKMSLELGKDGFQTVYVQEIVHIYAGFESKYEPATLPTLRSNRHTITLNYGDDEGETATDRITSTTINHGLTYGDNTYISGSPKHSNRAEYHFNEWLYNSKTSTTTPMVSSDVVLRPNTLYATWTENSTPTETDFTVSHLTQTSIPFQEVEIAPISTAKSQGTITIYYEGTGGTSYTKQETFPNAEGKYTVTYDIAADLDRWKAKTGLDGGTLTLSLNKTPLVSHYTFDHLVQKADSAIAVSITRTDSDLDITSPGAITIHYEGIAPTSYASSTTVPSTPGTYAVTFDVAAATGWSAATGFSAGTLVLTGLFNISFDYKPDNGDPVINTTLANTYATYDPSLGTLDIKVTLSSEAGANTFTWYFDTNKTTPIQTGAVSTLTKTLNIATDFDWWQAGDFTITLETDTNASVTFTFAHTW